MAKRRTRKAQASGERDPGSTQEVTPEVVEHFELTTLNMVNDPVDPRCVAKVIASPNPLSYINNAVPKLRASLVSTSDMEGDAGDLEVIRQILKKDRIKSSIYDIHNEAPIADAIKNSCAVIVNNPNHFKDVAVRAFLSGRYVITWFPTLSSDITEEESDYYHSPYCLHLRNISQVPEAVRHIRASYKTDTVQEIRDFVLERVKYE